jgi:hypothetical protein
MIHEMGTAKRYHKMLAELDKNGLRSELGKRMTPLDAALLLYLHDPIGLQNLHATLEVTRRRKYEYFLTDSYPVPRFDGPTLEQQRELERRLSDFYAAWGRAAAVKVCSFCQQRVLHGSPEWLFLVEHTAPLRCEGAVVRIIRTTTQTNSLSSILNGCVQVRNGGRIGIPSRDFMNFDPVGKITKLQLVLP